MKKDPSVCMYVQENFCINFPKNCIILAEYFC